MCSEVSLLFLLARQSPKQGDWANSFTAGPGKLVFGGITLPWTKQSVDILV